MCVSPWEYFIAPLRIPAQGDLGRKFGDNSFIHSPVGKVNQINVRGFDNLHNYTCNVHQRLETGFQRRITYVSSCLQVIGYRLDIQSPAQGLPACNIVLIYSIPLVKLFDEGVFICCPNSFLILVGPVFERFK